MAKPDLVARVGEARMGHWQCCGQVSSSLQHLTDSGIYFWDGQGVFLSVEATFLLTMDYMTRLPVSAICDDFSSSLFGYIV